MFLKGCKTQAPTDLSHSSALHLQHATLKDGAASLLCQEQTVYHSLWKQWCPKAQCSSPITLSACITTRDTGGANNVMWCQVLFWDPVSLAWGSHIPDSILEGNTDLHSPWPENGSSHKWCTTTSSCVAATAGHAELELTILLLSYHRNGCELTPTSEAPPNLHFEHLFLGWWHYFGKIWNF